jgi:hypothetical protein
MARQSLPCGLATNSSTRAQLNFEIQANHESETTPAASSVTNNPFHQPSSAQINFVPLLFLHRRSVDTSDLFPAVSSLSALVPDGE